MPIDLFGCKTDTRSLKMLELAEYVDCTSNILILLVLSIKLVNYLLHGWSVSRIYENVGKTENASDCFGTM